MNPILFFLAFIGIFMLLGMYISKRLIKKLEIESKYRYYLHIFLIFNLLGIIGYFLCHYYIAFPNWLNFFFSVPIGVLFLLFFTAILYDISRIILRFTPISQKRRDFFKRSLDISSLVVSSSLSARAIYEARYVKLKKITVKIKKLSKPYKIVQLSDTHIGGIIDREFIYDIVKRVNALNPDIVVITGDLIDIDIAQAKDTLDELKKLNSKYGTFFVVGNHEYFHNIQKIITKVKSLGIRVLENENVYIGKEGEGFNLAGVYDLFGYRMMTHIPEIDKALQGLKESPTILLAHQPRYIYEVTKSVDLMLSGHTHGGQLYPFKFLVKLQQPYISGLHRHNKELQIYISKGTGFWGPPMRLGASSEITDITIEPDVDI